MPCILCHSNQSEALFHNTLKKCVSCGLVSAQKEMSEWELKNIYTENYFKGNEYHNYPGDRNVITAHFKNRLSDISKIYPGYFPTNVLEIGCAYGFFGDLLKTGYPDAHYIGYDIVPEACEYAVNQLYLNVKCRNFADANDNETYTDVFMWDVIEHLPNPAELVHKISKHCNTGSRIFITTGDIGSLMAKVRGEKWRLIHPPTHLHYFTKKTITRLLENEGFKIRKISHPPVTRSIKQIFYSLFMLKQNQNDPWLRKIYDFIPQNHYLKINTFDIMFVIAEKQ